MAELILLSWAVLVGVDPRLLGFLTVAIFFPAPLLGFAMWHWWRHRSPESTRSVLFCEAVAGELRAGRSVRLAIEKAAVSVGAAVLARASAGGAPMGAVAEAVADEFPEVGDEISVCVERSAWLGAPSADLFDEIGSIALAQLEVRREVRAALGPAKATAVVLMTAAAIAIISVSSRGNLSSYLEMPLQRLAVLIGTGLVLAALATAAVMVRRVG